MAELAIKQNQTDALEAPFEEGEVQAGNPLPIGGAHQYGDGVNFVLFSRHATGVRLELYQHADDSSPTKIIDLDPARHRTGDVWHVWLQGIPAGTPLLDRRPRDDGVVRQSHRWKFGFV